MNSNINSKSTSITIDELALMIKRGFDAVDERFEAMDLRFDRLEAKFDNLDILVKDHSVRIRRVERKIQIA